MDKREKVFVFTNDLDSMRRLMALYGDSKGLFHGINENGEDTVISIFPDKIVVSTNQANGWTRVNTYYHDGSRDETFDGRWRESHDRV